MVACVCACCLGAVLDCGVFFFLHLNLFKSNPSVVVTLHLFDSIFHQHDGISTDYTVYWFCGKKNVLYTARRLWERYNIKQYNNKCISIRFKALVGQS